MAITLTLDGLAFAGPSTVGLVVRGKRSATHVPGLMQQHADCILPDGSPIGFYGDGPPRTSGGSSGGSSNTLGMNMTGLVADYTKMRMMRPQYVDLATAKKYGVMSTILTIRVTTGEAFAFLDYWIKLSAKPGGFDIVGNNCSTHASDAFITSGILSDGIPGLDTPDNLYRQLVTVKTGTTTSYSGHVGFTPSSTGDGFDVVID